MRTALYLFFYLSLPIWASAQQPYIFDDTLVHDIRLTLSLGEGWRDTLYQDFLNGNQENGIEIYRQATDIVIDGTHLPVPIGIKLRGNSSASLPRTQEIGKFPFKLSFDEYADFEYQDFKKINLNSNTFDPSFVHEKLAYDLIRSQQLPAPMAAYTRLYVNNTYAGLYLLIENIDKRYLRHHYGPDANDGNLYKAYGSYLQWQGPEQEAYYADFTLKTNEEENDWSRLIAFLDTLNNHDISTEHLETMFMVEHFLKLTALERFMHAWDNLSYAGANFFVYEREDGYIEIIPWDYNIAFQFQTPWLNDSYLIPGNNRPLNTLLFSDKATRQRYLNIACDMYQSQDFSIEHLSRKAYFFQQLINTAYQEDPNPTFPYAFFQKALYAETQETTRIPATGLSFRILTYDPFVRFLHKRRQWAIKQFELHNFSCNLTQHEHDTKPLTLMPNPAPAGATLTIRNDDSAQSRLFSIKILDLTGRTVCHIQPTLSTSAQHTITLPDLSAGVYIVVKQVLDGNTFAGKLIIY